MTLRLIELSKAPELLHVHLRELVGQGLRREADDTYHRLEHHEEMLVVVRIDRLAVVAQIDRAVDTPEPFSSYALHASIANGGGV